MGAPLHPLTDSRSDGNGRGKGQVALVLGAGLRPDGGPSLMLADRLATTARLYRRGTVRRVLASGDHGTPGHDEVRAMRERLVDLGVPDEAIFTDHAGFDTNPYGGAGRTATVREALARAKAVTDVVTHRRPRFLGPPVDLHGDGTLTKG